MGVPTMYAYLLSHYDKMSTTEQEQARAAAGRLRLTVSGSAACPLPIMQCWHALSGEASSMLVMLCPCLHVRRSCFGWLNLHCKCQACTCQ